MDTIPIQAKAVVFPGHLRSSARSARSEVGPDGLSQLIDRPFLQHVVEFVLGLGIRDLTFILRRHESFVKTFLGDGIRWGARFTYRVGAEDETGYGAIEACARDVTTDWILVVHGDRLPPIGHTDQPAVPTLFCWGDGLAHWSGWVALPGRDAHDIPPDISEPQLKELLLARGGVCVEVARPLTTVTHRELLTSTRRVLSGEFPRLLLGARERQPGVWVARNARVHATAELVPPVFLGENCRIKPFVRVGPAASIGRNCVIDRQTDVVDSVVRDGSYVGRQLVLRHAIVDRSRLINTKWDAEIEGVDDVILGSVFGLSVGTRLREICRQLTADVALLLAAPVLALLVAGGCVGLVPRLRRNRVVAAPTLSDPHRWTTFVMWSFGSNVPPDGGTGWTRHLLFCFLPGLWSVSAGHVGLTGPRPRTPEELQRLSAAKQSVYVQSRPGLLPHGQPQTAGNDDDLAFDGPQGLYQSLSTAGAYLRQVFESGWLELATRRQRRAR